LNVTAARSRFAQAAINPSGLLARAVAVRPLMATVSRNQAEQIIEDSWREDEQRRVARMPHGTGGRQKRCPACKAFASNLHEPCSCGWRGVLGWSR